MSASNYYTYGGVKTAGNCVSHRIAFSRNCQLPLEDGGADMGSLFNRGAAESDNPGANMERTRTHMGAPDDVPQVACLLLGHASSFRHYRRKPDGVAKGSF